MQKIKYTDILNEFERQIAIDKKKGRDIHRTTIYIHILINKVVELQNELVKQKKIIKKILE